MVEVLPTCRVRCPKCKSANLNLVETGPWSSIFEVRSGVFTSREGYHEPEGMERLDATCVECRHLWKVRRAIQITCVMEEPLP